MEMLHKILTEGSTAIFTCTFEDEDGAAITPASVVNWTIRSADGTQISSGSETAAATVYIVPSGTELSAPAESGEGQVLILVVETTYNGAQGNGLPIVKMVKFKLDNEPGQP